MEVGAQWRQGEEGRRIAHRMLQKNSRMAARRPQPAVHQHSQEKKFFILNNFFQFLEKRNKAILQLPKKNKNFQKLW